MTTARCTPRLDAQRLRSNGKRRLSQMKSGADAKHAYQIIDPTPSVRSSSPVLAGGRCMRGSATAPGGSTRRGSAAKREATSVTTMSAADTATTLQNSRSPDRRALTLASSLRAERHHQWHSRRAPGWPGRRDERSHQEHESRDSETTRLMRRCLKEQGSDHAPGRERYDNADRESNGGHAYRVSDNHTGDACSRATECEADADFLGTLGDGVRHYAEKPDNGDTERQRTEGAE